LKLAVLVIRKLTKRNVNMKLLKSLLIAGSLLSIVTSANATIITQADFNEQLSLPFLNGPDIRELGSLAEAVGLGVEIDESDEISNPGGYSGHADIDLSASGLLTLTSREPNGFGDYQLAVFSLSNILFDGVASITGVNIIGLGNELFRDDGGTLFPIPDVIYGADSVTITYATGDAVNSGDEFNFGEGLSAQFQLEFDDSVVVSEPGTLAVFALSLMTLGLRRRRRK
jgi:hypothetical protein